MPTFSNKTFASYFKNILGIDQSTNAGIATSSKRIQDGAGVNTAMKLSDDNLIVQPNNDDTTVAFGVANVANTQIFSVDTTNSKVLVGASAVSATTLFKEMGLYEFSPNSSGNHYPLIANNAFVGFATGTTINEALTYDDDWGNGVDPPTSVDVSGLTDPENAIAVYWYLENNITLDSVRYMCRSDVAVTLNFHLFSYDLDVSTNHGDLSNGVVNANAQETASAFSTIRTGTFTLDAADIDANKVIIGFAENVTSATDFSVSFNIKYHIR